MVSLRLSWLTAPLTLIVERPLPLTPAEKRLTKIGVPAKLLQKPPTRHTSWIPFSIRPFYLSLLTIFSFCLLAACETLRQISSRNQGLLFFEDTSEITTTTFIAYNYVPTILAVLYVIAWSLVDLDIKRLEPYFQLSARDINPASVLLLDYTFESSVAAPFRALGRRHWILAYTSSVFVLISLILPPLQSALIGIASVDLDGPITFQSWEHLKSSEALSQGLSPEYLDHATAIIQDGAELPPLITNNYAIAPFKSGSVNGQVNETWTASTQVFWAESSCQEVPGKAPIFKQADRAFVHPGDNLTSFDWFYPNISIPEISSGNHTCSLALNISISSPQGNELLFKTYWLKLGTLVDDPQLATAAGSASLSNGCDPYNFFTALIEFDELADPSKPHGIVDPVIHNMTATAIETALCRPKHFSAPALVTVKANNQSVVTVNVLGPPKDLGSHPIVASFMDLVTSDYRNPNFTYIISQNRLDDLAFHYINYTNQAFASKGAWPTFGTDYRDAVDTVYKLLFALVLGDNFDTSSEPSSLLGSSHKSLDALVVSPIFAIISEVILSIGGLTSIMVLFVFRKRQNVLRSDPDSISALCSLVVDCFAGANLLASQDSDKTSTKGLTKLVAGFQCQYSENEDKGSLEIDRVLPDMPAQGKAFLEYYSWGGHGRSLLIPSLVKRLRSHKSKSEDVYDELPFFVTTVGFGIAVIVLVGTIIGFSYLLTIAIRSGGFTYLADSNEFTQQLLWSFTPTLMATAIESALLVMHRDLSVLEPWVRLRNGNASAAQSLSLRYASRPPAAILAGTFKKRNFLLLFVSLVSISSSVLNIAMGGLFSQSFTTVQSPLMDFTPKYGPSHLTVNDPESNVVDVTQRAEGGFGLARTNITDDTRLVPWTTTDYSFMPLIVPSEPSNSTTVFQSTTTGIGAHLNCVPIPVTNSTTNSMGLSFVPHFVNGTAVTAGYFYWHVQAAIIEDGGPNITVTCASFIPVERYFALAPEPSWAGLGEFDPARLLDAPNRDLIDFCTAGPLIVIRSGREGSMPNSEAAPSPVAVSCEPLIDISEFSVAFDSQGYITSYDKIDKTGADNISLLSASESYRFDFRTLFGSIDLVSRQTKTVGTTPFNDTNVPSYDWAGLLLAGLENSTLSTLDGTDIVNRTSGLASQVFSRVFSAYFTLSQDTLLNKNGTKPQVQGTAFHREARMVPSIPAFAITLVLLSLYILTLILVIIFRRQRYSGPRMPISIGSLIPWIAHSNMLKDFEGAHHLSSDLRDEYLDSLGKRYGFGWFQGTNGRLRLGLEQEPLLDRYILDGK